MLRDQIIAGLLVPATAAITSVWNRRHKNNIEDQQSDAAAMTAVNDANIALTQLVVSTMEPLQLQIDKQEERIEAQEHELELHRKALLKHESQQRSLRQWVTDLIAQIERLGHTPVLPPDDLEP